MAEGSDGSSHEDWKAGWEAHRLDQLMLALEATPAQRLAWLEEMIELAHRTGAVPRPADQRSR
jgi:hypothetical protein